MEFDFIASAIQLGYTQLFFIISLSISARAANIGSNMFNSASNAPLWGKRCLSDDPSVDHAELWSSDFANKNDFMHLSIFMNRHEMKSSVDEL